MRDVSSRPSPKAFKHVNDGANVHAHPAGARPFLPIDAPPRPGLYNDPETTKGLTYRANLSGTFPIGRPKPPYSADSQVFPYAMQSNAGPAAAGSRIAFALNNWSPVNHWRSRKRAETMPIPAAIPRQFVGIAKGQNRRSRAVVIPQPFALPTWPTLTGRTFP